MPATRANASRPPGPAPRWNRAWREAVWDQAGRPWDVIIVGGGITGAGILREATRWGLRAILFEKRDFASGTSSHSSKLVHGGFRYLRSAQVRMVLKSVHERELLLKQGRGLITPLGFLMAQYASDPLPAWAFGAGLALYDLLGLRWNHGRYAAQGLLQLCPHLQPEELQGGYRYFDAQTDDARLVLRLLREASAEGGLALNYAEVIELQRSRGGRINGVVVQDQAPPDKGREFEVSAPVVISATGAWADGLRRMVGGQPRLRALRGSHLVFSEESLPINRAVSFFHPQDGRPVFAIPWEGVVVFGTTDVDHRGDLDTGPRISPSETDYLLSSLQRIFPGLRLTESAVLSTFAGVRAVVDTGQVHPSRESREHILWRESGLLTVSGGKLTTFRVMAHDALRAVRSALPNHPGPTSRPRMLNEPPEQGCLNPTIEPGTCLRLIGRYGADAPLLTDLAQEGELQAVPGSVSLWAELRWAAHAEGVIHLQDLLLRRVRLGLTLPGGGRRYLDHIQRTLQPELGWDAARWETERGEYLQVWEQNYSPPEHQAPSPDQRAA
jgi:glycerol-3-phosphate dehydrogenase